MLVTLYNAMAGDHWTHNRNWTRDLDLDEWYGVTTDPRGRIVLELRLSENEMFGTLPSELGDLSSLRHLQLGDNRIQGEIPSELGSLAELQYLSLNGNELRGEIPWELGNLTHLEVLALGGNRLEGEIPPELGDLANLRQLTLSGNRLRGEIPPELGNLSALEMLSLQDNLLEGTIPQELGDLTNLTSVDLSGNAALNGCMPEELEVAFCTAPRNLAVDRGDPGYNTITWDPVEGASHYVIWWDEGFWTCRSSSSFGCSKLGGNITDNTYTHATSSHGSYAIAACVPAGCGEWASTD